MNRIVNVLAYLGAVGLSGMGALASMAVVLPFAGPIPSVMAGVFVFFITLLLMLKIVT